MPRYTSRSSRLRLEILESRTLLATFTVLNTNDSGTGSFRQSILDANATPGLDTIAFSIGSGVKTITPNTALPTITDPVVVDGTTQPGSGTTPRIVLSGSKIQSATGLHVTAGSSTIRNLAVNGFSSGIGVHFESASNLITGSHLGTNASGTSKVANGTGVKVDGGFNTVGGTTVPLRNLISGNTTGVHLSTGTPGNVVLGNYIGTNVSGTSALGNTADGVLVNIPNFTVGGNEREFGNLISGNGNAGVNVFSTGPVVTNFFVRQNFIGTNAAGTAKIPNRVGVLVGAGAQIGGIGGGLEREGNLISGNTTYGVHLNGTLSGMRVGNNLIGTDVTGTLALGNGSHGVFIQNCANLTVGGPDPSAANTISGNGGSALRLSGTGTFNIRVRANRFGTNLAGTGAIPNFAGVTIDSGSTNNIIGGLTPNDRNTISGNLTAGIVMVGTNTAGNRIQGNHVGLSTAGTVKLANGTGISILLGAINNTVGGTQPAARNLISGNHFIGVSIAGPGTNGNLVQGNSIGTNAAGTVDLGNGGPGVAVAFEPMTNTVGGTAAGTGNIIAFNGDAGVYVNDSVGVNIRGNRIFSNGDLGIELEDGGNNNQPAPVFTEATSGPGGVVLTGTVTAAPNTTYAIEIFSNTVCDPSGFGEGEIFRSSTTATTDGSGSGIFASADASVAAGQFVSATATDPAGNTSEFSECRAVAAAGAPAPNGGMESDSAFTVPIEYQSTLTPATAHSSVVIRPEIQRLSVEAPHDDAITLVVEPRTVARINAHIGQSDAIWLEWSKALQIDL